MLLVPLTSVHIAMDILVHQQYAQEVDAVEIAARAGTAALGTPNSPLLSEPSFCGRDLALMGVVLSFLLGAVHPRKEAPILRIAMFGAFLALGVAMIHVSRDGSFYAVMVNSPTFPRPNSSR
jgi:hypothetical protein